MVAKDALDWIAGSPLCSRLPFPDVYSSLPLLLAILSLPHVLYAFVWLLPGAWRRLFGKNSIQALLVCGVVGKVLQGTWLLLWAWTSQPTGLCLRHPIGRWQWVAAVVMCGYGQALNLGTYRALGSTGVYYGSRLGRSVPWVNGWPFSAVPHPQYVGSALTVWGLLVLLASALPMPAAAAVAVWWTGLYVATGMLEHYF